MNLTIRSRLIVIALCSTLTTCAVGLADYLGIAVLSDSNEASMVATDAMRHHMEVDMQHEGLSADVHALLLARLRKDASMRASADSAAAVLALSVNLQALVQRFKA